MILEDLHVHTTYCDGTVPPEEMVRAALDLKMKRIGFSAHSYTAFDKSYCMTEEREYKSEIFGLKEKYRGKIEILCGIEQDYYSDSPACGYDYIIGSVHYIRRGDKYYAIDESAELFERMTSDLFGNDFYAAAEEYFRCVSDVVKKTHADIIGHFDLISKFNEGGKFFDEENPRYIASAVAAIERLIETGKPFEINTGAVSRGYRTEFYPKARFLTEIQKRGGQVILSSDSHSADTLCYAFEEAERAARECGLTISYLHV